MVKQLIADFSRTVLFSQQHIMSRLSVARVCNFTCPFIQIITVGLDMGFSTR
ncbi:hypothetical protein AB6G35_21085 [Providencia hangzhouensis]|uniref:hypothetical protein n=1 Tax=Providencia hangzhouensis TaxID=3031799 RepID=UPI0034DD43DD